MRNRFDNELIELNKHLIKMGTLCEHSISLAMKCFEEGDDTTVKDVRNIEIKIDEYENEIERRCLRLLLHQQPVAKDLRIISSILKMITDLERIGDQSVDIADLSRYTKKLNDNIIKMASETIKMLTFAIDSFVKNDLEIAKKTISKDDEIDALFLRVRCDIIDILKSEENSENEALDTLMIAKYLERIADHAVNVCEWVVFSITGLHKGEKYDSTIGR